MITIGQDNFHKFKPLFKVSTLQWNPVAVKNFIRPAQSVIIRGSKGFK
jgi:hypothetical protein